MREHGSSRLGGGGWVRDHGSQILGGGLSERPWVSEARWGAG